MSGIDSSGILWMPIATRPAIQAKLPGKHFPSEQDKKLGGHEMTAIGVRRGKAAFPSG